MISFAVQTGLPFFRLLVDMNHCGQICLHFGTFIELVFKKHSLREGPKKLKESYSSIHTEVYMPNLIFQHLHCVDQCF
jgi:hypothetical protein